MGSTQRKKPSSGRSASSRSKRKLASATTKALVNKSEHVKRQSLRLPAPVKASGTKKKHSTKSIGETPEVLRAPATDNSRPALDPTQMLAYWSPMALLLRQQRLLASMALNVMQSQRHWAQAFTRLA
jgi:hypothetical protein